MIKTFYENLKIFLKLILYLYFTGACEFVDFGAHPIARHFGGARRFLQPARNQSGDIQCGQKAKKVNF